MRVLAALGGNALLERGDTPTSEAQAAHVGAAVRALAPIAERHELVVTHGNGPQIGLLALESADDARLSHPYPLDTLGAETQGLIGYLLLQALENALPGRSVASLICQTLVDPGDPAFGDPTKFVGPVYDEPEARRVAAARGWTVRPDGDAWRRVVPSPDPKAIVELSTILALVEGGTLVVCAGGGGVPVVRARDGTLHGVEAVVDKDLAASLLAIELGAEALLILTDVPGVESGFGTADATVLPSATPEALRAMAFPPGSMGPKVEAACRFVERGGRRAVIGRLEDAGSLLDGRSGTVVERAPLDVARVRSSR